MKKKMFERNQKKKNTHKKLCVEMECINCYAQSHQKPKTPHHTTHTYTHAIDGSQAFNNTQRPARNPEIAQNPNTNSVAPTGLFNRFGNDDTGSSAAVSHSVALLFYSII